MSDLRDLRMKYYVSARTDTGRARTNNEDNFSVNEHYMLPPARKSYAFSGDFTECVLSVCDGMGGESYGELASFIGVSCVADDFAELLTGGANERKAVANRLIQTANAIICAEIRKKRARIGSTIVLTLIKDGLADIFNIGDSRAYLYRKNALTQLTKDHTVLQQKIDMGIISAHDTPVGNAKHQLTQHLGIFESEMIISADHIEAALEDGDIILLCSDGLTDMVSNDEIASVCGQSQDADCISSALVEKALENGGKDNVTVVVMVARGAEHEI